MVRMIKAIHIKYAKRFLNCARAVVLNLSDIITP
jgi:hypothetical protein